MCMYLGCIECLNEFPIVQNVAFGFKQQLQYSVFNTLYEINSSDNMCKHSALYK